MNTDSWRDLEERFRRLEIKPGDLTEQFVRSGGAGGQHVNKVASCVVLTHHPSGISVRCEEERSQHQNRYLARRRLADLLENAARQRLREKIEKAEKQRRQRRLRNNTSKERTLKFKRERSKLKQSRRRSWSEEH